MLTSEMPERWVKTFPPVKQVGQSEYSAMYDCIASGLEDIPEGEQLGLIRGMLEEFLGWAEALLKELPAASKPGDHLPIYCYACRTSTLHIKNGNEEECSVCGSHRAA